MHRPPDLLTVTVDESRGHPVVSVVGEVDLYTIDILRDALRPLTVRPGGVTVVDLTRVSFLGSSGLAELVGADRAAVGVDGEVRLVVDSAVVARPLAVSGLDTLFRVEGSVDAACR